MSDLVAETCNCGCHATGNLCRECCEGTSAGEIERLTAERDEWKAAAQEACDENNALRAERDRLQEINASLCGKAIELRAALERIKADLMGVYAWIDEIIDEALAGGEK